MKLYTEKAEDTQGKYRLYNFYSCDSCGKEYKKQTRFEGATQEHYCSKSCFHSSNNTLLELECAHCKVKFKRKPSSITKSKSGLYFCCREHKDIGQSYIKDIQPKHYGLGTGKYSYRDKALNTYTKVCNRCGIDNILVLEVHHIDRDRNNNHISNLEILCANCHTIEHKLRG